MHLTRIGRLVSLVGGAAVVLVVAAFLGYHWLTHPSIGDVRSRLDAVGVPAGAQFIRADEDDPCFGKSCPNVLRFYTWRGSAQQLVTEFDDRFKRLGYTESFPPAPAPAPVWSLKGTHVVVSDDTRLAINVDVPETGDPVIAVDGYAR